MAVKSVAERWGALAFMQLQPGKLAVLLAVQRCVLVPLQHFTTPLAQLYHLSTHRTTPTGSPWEATAAAVEPKAEVNQQWVKARKPLQTQAKT